WALTGPGAPASASRAIQITGLRTGLLLSRQRGDEDVLERRRHGTNAGTGQRGAGEWPHHRRHGVVRIALDREVQPLAEYLHVADAREPAGGHGRIGVSGRDHFQNAAANEAAKPRGL